jgi:hypothetical protein
VIQGKPITEDEAASILDSLALLQDLSNKDTNHPELIELGMTLISATLCDEHFANFALPVGLGLFKNFLMLCTDGQAQFLQATLSQLLDNTVSDSEAVIKNASLAIVLLLTHHPKTTYQPELQKTLQSHFKRMQTSPSAELQITAAQSMKALVCLSCNPTHETSVIGDIYIRLFLPCIVDKMFSEAEKLANKEKVPLPALEEELKTFLVLALTRQEERLSINHLTRIP